MFILLKIFSHSLSIVNLLRLVLFSQPVCILICFCVSICKRNYFNLCYLLIFFSFKLPYLHKTILSLVNIQMSNVWCNNEEYLLHNKSWHVYDYIHMLPFFKSFFTLTLRHSSCISIVRY